jgi:hypothetical protein
MILKRFLPEGAGWRKPAGPGPHFVLANAKPAAGLQRIYAIS